MFLFADKRKIFMCSMLIAGFLSLYICGAFHEKHEEVRPVIATPVSGKVIVIDPGHGGFDGGASDNGVFEKEINLDVALKLKEYIEQGGGVVYITRVDDVSTNENNANGKSAKMADLEARKELVNSAEADVFLSIHMNKFSQPQYRGAQVFYAGKSEESKKLGETIQETMKEVIDDGNTRVAKKIDGQIYILKNTSVPSVIIECGFLSNPQEASMLKNEEYRQKLAWSIYLGLLKYFN